MYQNKFVLLTCAVVLLIWPTMAQATKPVPERIEYCVILQQMSRIPGLLHAAGLSSIDEQTAAGIVTSFSKQFLTLNDARKKGQITPGEFSRGRDSLVSAARRQLGLRLSPEGMLKFVGFINYCKGILPPPVANDPVV